MALYKKTKYTLCFISVSDAYTFKTTKNLRNFLKITAPYTHVEAELAKNTWPREDYRELLRLTIVTLGGVVPGFQFLQPGPDHHARWMSKCLYYLKMKLLSNVFNMSEKEKSEVEEISQFIVILYVKAWFMSPLPTAAIPSISISKTDKLLANRCL